MARRRAEATSHVCSARAPARPSCRRHPVRHGGRVDDPFDLQRFLDAQDDDGTYDRALAELRDGRKRTHWMWFVLPQVAGLGRSPTARRYAVSGLEEARAYLAHPLLGPRLVACCRALTGLATRDAD